jgi:hypothetical protein
MPSVVFAGVCWACGAKSFTRHAPELPPAEGWFPAVLEDLKDQGWVFLTEAPGKMRAYCKGCWDQSEG